TRSRLDARATSRSATPTPPAQRPSWAGVTSAPSSRCAPTPGAGSRPTRRATTRPGDDGTRGGPGSGVARLRQRGEADLVLRQHAVTPATGEAAAVGVRVVAPSVMGVDNGHTEALVAEQAAQRIHAVRLSA